MKNLEVKYCECGCGKRVVNLGNRFITGHNRRNAKNSPEHNAAISRANSGDGNSAKRPEVRAKISKAHTGKKQSLETRMKRIASLTNNPKVIARRKRQNPRKGTGTRPEARANMRRAAQLRPKPTAEHCNNIRKGLLKHFSIPENRLRRAQQIAGRIKERGYQYKTGYVELPRLGIKLLYRSSYEKLGLLLLDMMEEVMYIEVETLRIPYVDVDNRVKIYLPDWLVWLGSGRKLVIEVKPECFLNDSTILRKAQAAYLWAKKHNATYCIWSENILHNDSSTTTSLREIVRATATDPSGRRYSLNSVETLRREQK